MDPTAPSITFFDKDTGKGRATYIGARRRRPLHGRHPSSRIVNLATLLGGPVASLSLTRPASPRPRHRR